MYLGKEATNSSNIPVYAMPKMRTYLSNNGPWSQLVETNNIKLMPLGQSQTVSLSKELEVTPFLVPHRDEYSETVGYKIKGPNKTALFIPDIDKWEKWETAIVNAVKQVDYAFLDATFYSGAEMNFRDISEIPHPFIIETMALFKDKPKTEKNKLIFIHLNHTNPALDPLSTATKEIEKSGFQVARINQVFTL
jgi:pyrroloquinoline quinone biosynthesis protein B